MIGFYVLFTNLLSLVLNPADLVQYSDFSNGMMNNKDFALIRGQALAISASKNHTKENKYSFDTSKVRENSEIVASNNTISLDFSIGSKCDQDHVVQFGVTEGACHNDDKISFVLKIAGGWSIDFIWSTFQIKI
jgi:hypothetical protein